jgi:hypothetical protein
MNCWYSVSLIALKEQGRRFAQEHDVVNAFISLGQASIHVAQHGVAGTR